MAVAGDPVNQQVFYFGAAAGGIWKTEDAGVYWENVSDGFLNSSAVGAYCLRILCWHRRQRLRSTKLARMAGAQRLGRQTLKLSDLYMR